MLYSGKAAIRHYSYIFLLNTLTSGLPENHPALMEARSCLLNVKIQQESHTIKNSQHRTHHKSSYEQELPGIKKVARLEL